MIHATRANQAQIHQHIQRQRLGIGGLEFAHRRPIVDAVAGAVLLAVFISLAVFGWLKVGAGV